jgi:OOP family OmpA-OmpF porin
VFFATSAEPDTDGDGVPDSKDKCPGTPKGVKVNSDGCPLDTDGDGVYDYMDECPGTPKGAKVDERGCWTIRNVHFDYNKFEVKKEYYGQLDDAVVVLKKNPDLKIRIDGHTDFRGSDAYNQTLSENRANAVKNYFIQQGISADILSVKGFGESQPVKPNDSEENMALNRRVELTVNN